MPCRVWQTRPSQRFSSSRCTNILPEICWGLISFARSALLPEALAVAAAIMVPISMGTSPVLAVVAGVAVGGYGILPGFIAGYVIGLIAPVIEKRLPEGLKYHRRRASDRPHGTFDRSGRRSGCKRHSGAYRRHDRRCHGTVPHRHGIPAGRHHQDDLYLPLSSTALTAMLGLDGLAMGIAACYRVRRRLLYQRTDICKVKIRRQE